MHDVLVLCPTRRRFDGAVQTYDSVQKTTSGRVKIAFYVDDDDKNTYHGLQDRCPNSIVMNGPPKGPVSAFNHLVSIDSKIYLCATDDMTFESNDWDLYVIDAVDKFPNRIGIISPSHNIGDFINFVTTTGEWIRTVGYLAYPGVYHFCWDTICELLAEPTGLVRSPAEFRVENRYLPAHNIEKLGDDCFAFCMWVAQNRRDTIQKILAAQGRA